MQKSRTHRRSVVRDAGGQKRVCVEQIDDRSEPHDNLQHHLHHLIHHYCAQNDCKGGSWRVMVSPFMFLSQSPSLLSLSLSALLTTPMHHAHAIPECTSLLPLPVFLSSQTGCLPSLSQWTIFSRSLFSPVHHECLSVFQCDQRVFFPFLSFPLLFKSLNYEITNTNTLTHIKKKKERKKSQ